MYIYACMAIRYIVQCTCKMRQVHVVRPTLYIVHGHVYMKIALRWDLNLHLTHSRHDMLYQLSYSRSQKPKTFTVCPIVCKAKQLSQPNKQVYSTYMYTCTVALSFNPPDLYNSSGNCITIWIGSTHVHCTCACVLWLIKNHLNSIGPF